MNKERQNFADLCTFKDLKTISKKNDKKKIANEIIHLKQRISNQIIAPASIVSLNKKLKF